MLLLLCWCWWWGGGNVLSCIIRSSQCKYSCETIRETRLNIRDNVPTEQSVQRSSSRVFSSQPRCTNAKHSKSCRLSMGSKTLLYGEKLLLTEAYGTPRPFSLLSFSNHVVVESWSLFPSTISSTLKAQGSPSDQDQIDLKQIKVVDSSYTKVT